MKVRENEAERAKQHIHNVPLRLSEDDAAGGSEGRDKAGCGLGLGGIAIGVMVVFAAGLGENMRHPDFWARLAN